MAEPRITKIELHEYAFTLNELTRADNGFNLVYSPGSSVTGKGYVLRLLTDAGVAGEYAGGGAVDYSTLPGLAQYLIGKNAPRSVCRFRAAVPGDGLPGLQASSSWPTPARRWALISSSRAPVRPSGSGWR